MDDSASLKGQLLIRSIIEEYRNLLGVLADPQLLSRRPNDTPEGGLDQSDTRKTTQEILQKLTRLFSQLKTVYNQCLDELERSNGFEAQRSIRREDSVSEQMQDLQNIHEDSSEGSGTDKIAQELRHRNNQLKSVVDEMRQLIWDIDVMRS